MFATRDEAGTRLAAALAEARPEAPVVLALPRGGVPVALPVAKALAAPLNLLMVRKLGVPGQPELAAGAVVEARGVGTVFNPEILRHMACARKISNPPSPGNWTRSGPAVRATSRAARRCR